MGRLIAVADVFVDRDILRFAGAESVSSLEGDVIAGFLNVKPPSLAAIARLVREGKYGEIADLLAEMWGSQFRETIAAALWTQVRVAGDAAARKLGRDGFGVEEMITAAVEGEPRNIIFDLLHEDDRGKVSHHYFATPALAAPSFDPTDPRVSAWIEGRVGAIVGALEDDARAIVSEAIKRGAAEQLTDRQVARVIQQHVGLDQRRAVAVENYRQFLNEFRARQDMERLVKKRPKSIRERLQKGGFKRKEWKIIREHGVAAHLTNRRLDNMAKEYAGRLKKERALSIAQTEINMAKNKGREFAWEEAQESGALLPGAKRKWVTREDEKVCKFCGPMHGRLAPVGGMWSTLLGEVSTPNQIHSKCRCSEVLVAKPRNPRKPRRHLGPRKKKR